MAEQAANALLPASGAGGLALGAWALRRDGMDARHIARRSVAFFLLTSLANVGAVIVFAALYATGILHHDPNRALTYGFGAASLAVIVAVLALPRLLSPRPSHATEAVGRLRTAVRLVRESLADGIGDSLRLLRGRGAGAVLSGSIGTMAFDLATLGMCFRAFGAHPAIGVLVLGYLIGQLGGNLPLPGGLGGIEGGLVGTFALYHQPVAQAAAAVLVYHAIALWLPALLGSAAFVELRKSLARGPVPASEPRSGNPQGTLVTSW
jgi:uncharacterized membrane protein YbhN (UPF0104 family)